MGKFIGNLFAKEGAKRHLIQLGITVGLMVWVYIILSALTGNWNWFSPESKFFTDKKLLASNVVGFSLMFVCVAIAGCLTYWNVKKWMIRYLKRSILYILGIIPFVNLLVPEEMMNSWWEEIQDLNSSDGTVTTYYDRWGKLYSDDGSIPLLLAIPLGIIKALLKGIFCFVLNLIIAIGIPVFSPVLMVLGLIVAQLLVDWNITTALIIAVILVLVVVLMLVVHPILVLVKSKKNSNEDVK